ALLATGLLVLGACGQADDAAPMSPAAEVTPAPGASPPAETPDVSAPIALALDAEGLRFVASDTGRTSLLAFGAERPMVESAVQRAASGSPTRSSGDECPAGSTQFTRFGELQLAFQDERWIGWALGGQD